VLVPEGRQLFAAMSVQENLEMGAYSTRAQRRFDKCLSEVFTLFPRLKDRRRQIAGTFLAASSRCWQSRGLMSDPGILIIDELSLGLAPVVVHQLFDTLKTLRETGISIAYVMAQGKLFTEGKPAELAKRRDIREAYLGL